jgi:hypothetical protein
MKAVSGNPVTCFVKEFHIHRYFGITDKIPQLLLKICAKVILIIYPQVSVPASSELDDIAHSL